MSGAAKSRQHQKEDRRQAILAAARHELETVGYHGLNIRNVAASAQMSLGLMYRYFANKEELFATLYAERLQQFRQQAEAICQHNHTPETLLVELSRAYVPIYQTFGRELNVFSVLKTPEQFSVEVAALLTQTAVDLMTLMYQHTQTMAQAQGIVWARVPQAELVLPSLWIILNGLADHFAGERQYVYGHDLDTMARFMARTFWAGINAQMASLSTDPRSQESGEPVKTA